MNLENHCGKTGCMCTHSHGCEKGWIWIEYIDETIIRRNTTGARDAIRRKYQGVYPCAVCDSVRYEIYMNSRTPDEYHDKLRNRGTFKKQPAYDDNERSQTRTL